MRQYQLLVTLFSCTLLMACSLGKESPRGFSLPEGDVDAGREAFVTLNCNACHSTEDDEQIESANDIAIKLGGDVGYVKTYADLVTSIINPSHRLAKGYPAEMVATGPDSRMRNYNAMMTVEQLTDLVTYLQPLYPLVVYEPTAYRAYPL